MLVVRKYSDLLVTLTERPELKSGIVADSNVLISATYESDRAHDQTVEFLDLLSEQQIPIFCNVKTLWPSRMPIVSCLRQFTSASPHRRGQRF